MDRYYIEAFLERHRDDIRGRVLEIADDMYTRMFGGEDVSAANILQYREGEHPEATFTGDLADCPELPSDAFDCVVLTQTLQLIYDVHGAIATIHRILKPNGVLLATMPGITPVNRHDADPWGEQWCWSFTARSIRLLLQERFHAGRIGIETFGNVLTSSAFLYGLSQQDLTRDTLDHHDPDYEMLIAVRAVKQGA